MKRGRFSTKPLRPTRSSARASTPRRRRHSATATWSGSPAILAAAQRSPPAWLRGARAARRARLRATVAALSPESSIGKAASRRRSDSLPCGEHGLRGRHLVTGALPPHACARPRRLGQVAAAEAVAREALATVEKTDLLELHGDTLLDLGHVLRAARRPIESGVRGAGARSTSAEGALVCAEWARALLGAGVTRRMPSRSATRAVDRPRRQGRHVERRPGDGLEAPHVAEADPFDHGLGDRVDRRAVEQDLVVGGVELQQPVDERVQGLRLGLQVPVELPGRIDLPEDERGRRVRLVPRRSSCRLVALPAVLAGVDAQVREEAVLGGDGRQHPRRVAPPCAPGARPRATGRRRRPDARRTPRRHARPPRTAARISSTMSA